MMRALFIEPPMSEAEAAVRVSSAERAAAQEFLRERRRREFLTWRAIVRRELGPEVQLAYNEAGAPVVVGRDDVHIGVSHCRDRVAVCISDAPCAVDIEPQRRDFSRAVPRYMSSAEQTLSDDPLLPAVVWCAKETLYKYAGRPGLDLLHDLQVDAVDLEGGTVVGRIGDGEPLRLSIRRDDGFVAVYIM